MVRSGEGCHALLSCYWHWSPALPFISYRALKRAMALGRVPHPDLPMVPLLMNPGQLNMELLLELLLGMELLLLVPIPRRPLTKMLMLVINMLVGLMFMIEMKSLMDT
nr:hypothetical protein ABT39_MTgene4030 [Picea glauca]